MTTLILALGDTPTTWPDVAWTAVILLGIAAIAWAMNR